MHQQNYSYIILLIYTNIINERGEIMAHYVEHLERLFRERDLTKIEVMLVYAGAKPKHFVSHEALIKKLECAVTKESIYDNFQNLLTFREYLFINGDIELIYFFENMNEDGIEGTSTEALIEKSQILKKEYHELLIKNN